MSYVTGHLVPGEVTIRFGDPGIKSLEQGRAGSTEAAREHHYHIDMYTLHVWYDTWKIL